MLFGPVQVMVVSIVKAVEAGAILTFMVVAANG
jgi:hypothetical protein